MIACAEGGINSLLLDGPARQSDIDEFITHSSEFWGVEYNYDAFSDKWIMTRVCVE